MISIEEVKRLISTTSKSIETAREMAAQLSLHVEGTGLQQYLEQINGYENADQFNARQKHAISNTFLTEELLRPTDNAFSAKGGSKSYRFSSNNEANTDGLVQLLTNVNSGMSLTEYIENTWFHYFLVDPNGLIFVQAPTQEQIDQAESEGKVAKAKPVYKSIFNIHDYKPNGQEVDWVIFEPHAIEDVPIEGEAEKTVEVKFFWVVDEAFYYLYKIEDGELAIVQAVENTFEKVPAVLCSNLPDYKTGLKRSPIHNQVEFLNKYLVQNSVLSIAEFFYNYPREWTYIDECGFCNGTGKVPMPQKTTHDAIQFSTCSVCDGSGKDTGRDVTDILKLKIPGEGQTKIDPPSGFTYMPPDSWRTMTESVDRSWDIIYFSHWGTMVEKGDSNNETATGRFIDVQPVHNRLEKYSRTIEKTHTSIATLLGEYYYPETFERAVIQYGRRYLVETPDQIWKKYLDSKKENAPVSILDMLLYQFLESEYRENEEMFMYEMKKVMVEPFVHWSVELVRASTTIAFQDKARKEYFNEWCLLQTKQEIIETDIEELKKSLDEFVTSKGIVEPKPISQNE